MALEDGRPKDVNKKFVASLIIYDENMSWFLNENVKQRQWQAS